MKARLLPSASVIIALVAVAALLVATVGASNDGTKGAQREDGGESSAVCAPGHPDCDDMIVEPGGDDVANSCIEGTVDCNDTIDVPVDGGGGTSNMCIEGVPDCNDTISYPSQPGVYDVGADFTADYTQADMDRVEEIILAADPSADVLVLERFPPAAAAHIHNKTEGFCDDIIARLEAVHGVAGATCIPSSDAPIEKPDEPVSSDPSGSTGEDVPNSSDFVAPDDCSLVHNVDACEEPPYDPDGFPAN
ncbi:MAG: hypothetical protein WEB04_04160 [Dehalococcoidia bacterium]